MCISCSGLTVYLFGLAGKSGDVAIPTGLIVMWHGLVANVPTGWAVCDGTLGTPNLQGKFVKGATGEAGTTGGAATHTHTGHSAHVVTQPAAHSNHIVTQPAAHSNHVVTQPSAHVVTQPAVHAAHVVTQPSAHTMGSILASGAAAVKVGTSGANAEPTGHTHTAPTITAHVGTAVDAHSAHTGAAVDAHSGTAVDAHSAHSGASVDAHSAHSGTAVDAHSAHDSPNSEPPYYEVIYIMKL